MSTSWARISVYLSFLEYSGAWKAKDCHFSVRADAVLTSIVHYFFYGDKKGEGLSKHGHGARYLENVNK